jgi:hypothetical protein
MAEQKTDLEALKKIKAKQEAAAKTAAKPQEQEEVSQEHPANDVAKMKAKQSAGQGNQGRSLEEPAVKEEAERREEAAQQADEDVQAKVDVDEEENLVAVDEIEEARDQEKIKAGLVPPPEGTHHIFADVKNKAISEFEKKTQARRDKYEAQQREAFASINKGDNPKVAQSQAGDSPDTVDSSVKPEGGGNNGPSRVTTARR